MINYRHTPFFIATVLAVALNTANQQALAAQTAPPNIIIMMADDLGWGDVGFNGNKKIKTPHLDAMAKAGLKFNRFYAAAPVCSPTRGSVLTGRHPYRYGIPFANTGHMKALELTVAELMQKKGYATGHFGKWHLGTLTKTVKDANRGGPGGAKNFSPPQVNGFDVCFSTESKVPTWDPMWRPKGNKSRTWWDAIPANGDPAKHATHYNTRYWNQQGKIITDNLRGDDSRVIMDRAIPFIGQSAKAKKPFFTIIWFHTPHLPVVAGPKHAAMYKKYDKHTMHYYGCITAMDEQIGRLRKSLRDLNIAQNTLVTFCSDNGPEGSSKAPGSAGGLRGRKRSLYEGGVRVPGLIEWPAKIKAGSVTEIPAVTSDYLPTVVELVGATYADKRPIDGISLLPLIQGKMTSRPSPIGFESRGQVALIDNQYKLIKASSTGKGTKKDKAGTGMLGYALYDLTADRAESNDLAKQKKHIVTAMHKTLQTWRTSCQASDAGKDY